MYTLSPLTCTRLKRLPKHPVIWEGDRRSIGADMLEAFGYNPDTAEDNDACDCILWMDATEGALRAVSIVPTSTGPEAVVRTLLQAMEHPQGAIPPARPQKLLVCDREIQFFLRGALQNLDIAIDHTPALPLIDEIFESLQQQESPHTPQLPEDWMATLQHQARRVWDNAPWNHLGDNQILSVTLNRWELDTLYVSVLGMAGLEYGLLLYRSQESLMQFRETALVQGQSTQQMQQAFLSQDCLFLNFELLQDDDDGPMIPLPWLQSAPSAVEPEFGSLHPLEGLRTALELEEAAALKVSLEALNSFFEDYESTLATASTFPELKQIYSLEDPIAGQSLSVTVQTQPQVTVAIADLELAAEPALPASLAHMPRFRDDYVPEGALILLTCLSSDVVSQLRTHSGYHSNTHETDTDTSSPLPAVVIQTSRPKAQTLVSQLQAAKSVEAVCFNPGRDPMTGEQFHIGLLKTGNGDFHLFSEYCSDDPREHQMVERWQQWQQDYSGRCGVWIVSGVTGKARGKPGVRETVAFFETRSRPPEDLELPPLKMSYALEWE